MHITDIINNKSKVKVIGGFKNSPNNTSGTRVFIHVNNDVASKKGDFKNVALRTGNGWQVGTILSVDVGSGGGIYGAGGDGGKGRVCVKMVDHLVNLELVHWE